MHSGQASWHDLESVAGLRAGTACSCSSQAAQAESRGCTAVHRGRPRRSQLAGLHPAGQRYLDAPPRPSRHSPVRFLWFCSFTGSSVCPSPVCWGMATDILLILHWWVTDLLMTSWLSLKILGWILLQIPGIPCGRYWEEHREGVVVQALHLECCRTYLQHFAKCHFCSQMRHCSQLLGKAPAGISAVGNRLEIGNPDVPILQA